MAELVRYRGQVTSKSADSNLQPVTSRTVFVTKRGATFSSTSSSTALPLEAGGLRFSTSDKVMIEGDESTYRAITSVDSDTQITITGAAIAHTNGDRLVNLGPDTGATTPSYDGYASTEFIYTDPVDTGTEADDNKVTSDSTDGEYGFWVVPGSIFDLHIMDSDGKLTSTSETKPDESVGSDHREYKVDGAEYPFTQAGLQLAVDRCESEGGGTVKIGVGTLSSALPITAGSNTTIEGHGWQTILKSTSGATTMTAMFENKDLAGSGNSNITIRDLKIDMDDTTLDYVTTASSNFRGRGIRLEKVTDILIENVWVHDYSNAGIFFNDSCKRLKVLDNLVEQGGKAVTNMTTEGIFVQHTQATSAWANCNEILIRGNTVRDILGQGSPNGIAVTFAKGVRIIGNSISDVDDDGGTGFPRGILASGQDFVIANNEIFDITNSAASGAQAQGIGGGSGSVDGQPHNYAVTGNKIRNVHLGCILQDVKDLAFTGNSCQGDGVAATSKNGIEISADSGVTSAGDLKNITIAGNTFSDFGGNGLSLSAFLAETSTLSRASEDV